MHAHLTLFSSSHMHPHSSILFLIAFSFIPCASAGSREDSETEPPITFDSDARSSLFTCTHNYATDN